MDSTSGSTTRMLPAAAHHEGAHSSKLRIQLMRIGDDFVSSAYESGVAADWLSMMNSRRPLPGAGLVLTTTARVGERRPDDARTHPGEQLAHLDHELRYRTRRNTSDRRMLTTPTRTTESAALPQDAARLGRRVLGIAAACNTSLGTPNSRHVEYEMPFRSP